jgi:hypothetical protein
MKWKAFVPCSMLIFLFCASPGHFMSSTWPQKSIQAATYGDSLAGRRVLIGGISSPFKDAIVKTIVDSLIKDSVFVKTVGMGDLKKEKATSWNAVLLLNTCMAWELNYKVKKFAKKYPEYTSIVAVTTSGDPKTCGSAKQIPGNIDAISTASEKQKLPEVTSKVLDLLRIKIYKGKEYENAR